jgi:hypothetical protein
MASINRLVEAEAKEDVSQQTPSLTDGNWIGWPVPRPAWNQLIPFWLEHMALKVMNQNYVLDLSVVKDILRLWSRRFKEERSLIKETIGSPTEIFRK